MKATNNVTAKLAKRIELLALTTLVEGTLVEPVLDDDPPLFD
jgi:hypothetical protein